jgi:hypothetical protein
MNFVYAFGGTIAMRQFLCKVFGPPACRRTHEGRKPVALSLLPRPNLASFEDSAGAIPQDLKLYDFVHSIGNAFATLPFHSLSESRAGRSARLCKLPEKPSLFSWSRTIG